MKFIYNTWGGGWARLWVVEKAMCLKDSLHFEGGSSFLAYRERILISGGRPKEVLRLI